MKLIVFAVCLLLISVASTLYLTMGRSSAKKEYQQCVQAGGEVQLADLATCTWPNSEEKATIELER